VTETVSDEAREDQWVVRSIDKMMIMMMTTNSPDKIANARFRTSIVNIKFL